MTLADDRTYVSFVTQEDSSGVYQARLQLTGLHCANCIAAVERRLQAVPHVSKARVHFTSHILDVSWTGKIEDIDSFAQAIQSLGYGVTPLERTTSSEDDAVKPVLRALVWAGFGTGNIMMFAAPVWFTDAQQLDEPTRQLLHWLMALVALVVVPMAGQPFFKSAYTALKHKRTNMDVPISVGVILSTLVSVYGLIAGADHVYFDAGVMLLFFLLIGRYLDIKMRAKAKTAAASILSILSASATIIGEDGHKKLIPLNKLVAGMVLSVAAGERIMADGVVIEGSALLDTSLITGETMPVQAAPDMTVISGAIPLDAPLKIKVSIPHQDTMLAQVIKTMQTAAQEKSYYVRLADKIARAYTPVVHILAAITLVCWLMHGSDVPNAIMYAVSVLIITCPCALGLAVPVVQILAAQKLMKKNVVLKTSDALERMAQIDTVALDKTGTLTYGTPGLMNMDTIPAADLGYIKALAGSSRHPLSRALHDALADQDAVNFAQVKEIHGSGMEAITHEGTIIRLGNAKFVETINQADDTYVELWVRVGSAAPYRLYFEDAVRQDAAETVGVLKSLGLHVMLLSGDRLPVVAQQAKATGIDHYFGALSPVDKAQKLKELSRSGHHVLMVGDGLNDAPGLSSAHASIAPATGVDMTQNVADAIFLGKNLRPIADAVLIARQAQRLVKSNFILAIAYNVIAVPSAMLGYCTPPVAAASMSLSSVLVVLNALRLVRERNKWE